MVHYAVRKLIRPRCRCGLKWPCPDYVRTNNVIMVDNTWADEPTQVLNLSSLYFTRGQEHRAGGEW